MTVKLKPMLSLRYLQLLLIQKSNLTQRFPSFNNNNNTPVCGLALASKDSAIRPMLNKSSRNFRTNESAAQHGRNRDDSTSNRLICYHGNNDDERSPPNSLSNVAILQYRANYPELKTGPLMEFTTNLTKQLSLMGGFLKTDILLPWILQRRCFASKSKRPQKGKQRKGVDTDDEDDEDDDDDERDWDPDRDEEDADAASVKEWKDFRQHVPSLRLDAVLSAGLGISRKKIEDAYLGVRLRLNGEKVIKKSKQIKEGDILDLILEKSTPSQSKGGEAKADETTVMRIHVREISADLTDKGRVPVLMRRWKNLKITKEKLTK